MARSEVGSMFLQQFPRSSGDDENYIVFEWSPVMTDCMDIAARFAHEKPYERIEKTSALQFDQ